MNSLSKKQTLCVCALIGALYFLCVFGASPLNPRHTAWLLSGDTLNHYLGWQFFRNSAWALPPGRILDWVPELQLSVVQTDSIPGLALLLKPFSPLLGDPFQYTGLWLLLCFCLQGFCGGLLAFLCTTSSVQALLAAALFVLSPPLLWRYDHKSLCAHWIVLAALYAYLRFRQGGAFAKSMQLFFLVLTAALMTHAYFVAMCLPLFFAFLWEARRTHSLRHCGHHLLLWLLWFPSLAWSLGYLGIRSPAVWGWPLFSTDLLSFLNSYGKSAVLPAIRRGGSQHEGYAYLGLGIILLSIYLCSQKFSWIRRKATDYGGALLATALLLWFYSLSSHITLGGNTILKLDFFYDQLPKITGTFRSSGRFLWPLYYLLLTGILWATIKSQKRATLLLAAALLLQCFDLGAWALGFESQLKAPIEAPAADPYWSQVAREYKKIEVIPPVLQADAFNCGDEALTGDLLGQFLVFAAAHKLQINSSYTARSNTDAVSVLCGRGVKQIIQGSIDPSAVYILDRKGKQSAGLLPLLQAQSHCEAYTEYFLCLPKQAAAKAGN